MNDCATVRDVVFIALGLAAMTGITGYLIGWIFGERWRSRLRGKK